MQHYRLTMPRFLMGWLLSLALAAIGLVLCTVIFGDDFEMTKGITGFLVALVIFAVLNGIIPLIVFKLLRSHADSMIALTGLISAFLSLWITSILPWGGLSINSFGTLVLSSLLVWVLSMVIWVIPGPWRTHRREAERR